MKPTTAFGVFVVALAVVFVTASGPGAFAQDPKGGGGGGGQGGGGGAAPRGGGGGGDTGGARGGGMSSPAPSSSGGSSGGSGGGSVWGGGSTSGGSSGTMAVPRGAGRTNAAGGERQPGVAGPRGSGGGGVREGRPADGSSSGRSRTDDQMSDRARPGSGTSGVESSVPWYSRPRGSNPVTGTAVPRTDAPTGGGGGGTGGYYPYPGYPGYPGYGGYWNGYYDCSYYPYGCGNPWGYGAFGLGYFYFNPFAWNYGDYANWGGGGGGGSYSGQPMGSVRLKVKPNTASVYVDGYYAGNVDSFDNAFQKLAIGLGSHRIEISEPGYQPLIFELNVQDYDTIVYEGRLEPIR